MASIKRNIEKMEHVAKVNPGHRASYKQPLRPRSVVYKSKKIYNRQPSKKCSEEY